MLVDRSRSELGHHTVPELPQLLPSGSLVVLNDTRVLPARIYGRCKQHGTERDFLLLQTEEASDHDRHERGEFGVRHRDPQRGRGEKRESGEREGEPGDDCAVWKVSCKGAQRMRGGRTFVLPEERTLTVLRPVEDGVVVRIEPPPDQGYLERVGHVPLPPYIRRSDRNDDRERYQTVYARRPGSVAAPTAGLHLTEGILRDLQVAGHEICSVTLHVGLGTFLPVRSERVEDHRMHAERYEVPEDTAHAVTEAKRQGRPVVAVGTTSLRTLEAAWRAPEEELCASCGQSEGRQSPDEDAETNVGANAATNAAASDGSDPGANRGANTQPSDRASGGRLRAGADSTNLFIYPGYRFGVVDALFTNFHTPESTLFMLVCAFCGTDRAHAAYAEAIRRRYRFFSYGDAMLIR